jgi:hypothetical protein
MLGWISARLSIILQAGFVDGRAALAAEPVFGSVAGAA